VNKGLGQYDDEYRQCPCFWGTTPGRFVGMLTTVVRGGTVLDLGAGEGKNAIFLASAGFEVIAVECSDYALKNFRRRLASLENEVRERLQIVQADVSGYIPAAEFDVVIAYGLLHCLSSISTVRRVVEMMQTCTRCRGFNVLATFTDDLPVPDVHGYLDATLLPRGNVEQMYAGWEVLACENTVLEEAHPTTKLLHRHSICRLMARKQESRK